MRHCGRFGRLVGFMLGVILACARSVSGQDLGDSGVFPITTQPTHPGTRAVTTQAGPSLASLSPPAVPRSGAPHAGNQIDLASAPWDEVMLPVDTTNDRAIGTNSRVVFSGPTDLEDLISYALANNREIQATRFHAQSLSARIPQARSLPDPTLMATFFLEEVQTAAGPQQVAMSLSQKLPWFGKRALRSQIASYDAMAAYARVASNELKVIEQVKRAYYDVYFAQNAIKETRRLAGPLEDVIAIAKTKYETSTGKAGLESVFQAQMELAKLMTDLIRLEESERQAQAQLADGMHLPSRMAIEAVYGNDRNRIEKKVETLVGLADSCQPEYEAYRRELARDRTVIDLASREYWPDLTTSFNWYEMGSGGLSPVANGRDAFSVGIAVNLPIYHQRLHAVVDEAENRLCATARRYDRVRDQFQTEIETLHAQFREHHRTLEILERDILPRAEETLKLTQESYRAGRVNFQQLMDVYRTLLRYQIDLHRHLARSEQAIAALERAVGCAVTSPIEENAIR